jgi:YhgE/Pip-like protein
LLDPDRFANFFSEPIELVENKLFSIPNYWSAMSPFFTVLAIWVWSLLLIAMFSTKVKDPEYQNLKWYEKFFGKWLFFLTISIAQWLIVSLWEILFLWVYVSNLGAFIVTALVCSLVFSMIAFACVHTFWNSWKAIMIIYLVLQLSGSWWTFPVEMSDPFFQSINPYLPFTYAIRMMREAIWWVVPQVYYANLLVFLWFFVVFLFIWLFIQPLIEKPVARFDHKFAESELWEE